MVKSFSNKNYNATIKKAVSSNKKKWVKTQKSVKKVVKNDLYTKTKKKVSTKQKKTIKTVKKPN